MPDENIPSNSKQGKRVPEDTDVPPDKIYDAKAGTQIPSGGEVVGHGVMVVKCYAGDWTGYVPSEWTYFICPNGHLNYI